MINYSIIIPHKNCPDLLERCIDSIPQRTDTEIIVVDDNTPDFDFSALNCSKRDDIRFVKCSKCGGGGAARNVGLSIASGKWVIFSDSDDTFCTENLNFVMNKYETSEDELIFFGINCLDSETLQKIPNAKSSYIAFINDPKEPIEKCRYMIKVPWGKMIKRELILKHRIKFDETRVGNDAWFSLQVGYCAAKVSIDKIPIYNWLVRVGSVTSHRDKNAVMTHFNLTLKLNKFKREVGLPLYRESILVYIPMMMRAGISSKEIFSLIFSNLSLCSFSSELRELKNIVLSKL